MKSAVASILACFGGLALAGCAQDAMGPLGATSAGEDAHMKAKKIIAKLLLAFVLVSICFAAGKETTRGRPVAAGPIVAPGQDKLVVYYMHASFRCVTCNLVESMGQELVRTEFADAVKAGKIEWRAADYQKDAVLADRYSVGGNMIVVVKFRGGKEVESRRLDRVMELAGNRGEFMAYVRAAIHELLGAEA